MEKFAGLLYKNNVNLQFINRCALLGVFVLLFGFSCVVNAQSGKESEGNKLAPADRRLIIAVLLNERFKNSPESVLYLTTANIPEEIQKDFPTLKDKTVRLVSPETARQGDICAYEFGEFQFVDKFVSVSFGNCREGLAYDFVKEDDRWKTVSSTITRELFY